MSSRPPLVSQTFSGVTIISAIQGLVVKDRNRFNVLVAGSGGVFVNTNMNVEKTLTVGDLVIGNLTELNSSLVITGEVIQTGSNPPLLTGQSNAAPDNSRDVIVCGCYAYVSGSNELAVIDVTQADAPQQVGNDDSVTIDGRLKICGQHAYATDVALGFMVFDVSDPANPTLIFNGFFSGSILNPGALYVCGCYAYVCEKVLNTVHVIDISNPLAPVVASSFSTTVGTVPESIYVLGCYLYITSNDGFGDGFFEVYDISDPLNVGTAIGIAGADVRFLNVEEIVVCGRYAYLANNDTNSKTLTIVNVGDPSDPAITSSIGAGTDVVGLAVSGNLVYTSSTAENAIRSFNVSNPASPSLVQTFVNASLVSPRGIYVSGRYLYVTLQNALQLAIVSVNGTHLTSVFAGNLKTDNLDVKKDAKFAGCVCIDSGLIVDKTLLAHQLCTPCLNLSKSTFTIGDIDPIATSAGVVTIPITVMLSNGDVSTSQNVLHSKVQTDSVIYASVSSYDGTGGPTVYVENVTAGVGFNLRIVNAGNNPIQLVDTLQVSILVA